MSLLRALANRSASRSTRSRRALTSALRPQLRRIGPLRVLVRHARAIRSRNRGHFTRGDYAELVRVAPGSGRILEIGPFAWPLVRGRDVAYADVLTTEGIRARARDIGANPDSAPEIDFVIPASDLSAIEERFRAVVSCHLIEHQPDLIGHLQQVAQLLEPGGRYFLIVPDRRYCADHYVPSSTLAELIAARSEKRVAHVLRSFIEGRALTVHNDPIRHWAGDHGRRFDDFPARLSNAIAEFAAAEDYIDLHTWFFDPTSFRDLMTDLGDAGQIPFRVEAVYPTRRDDVEFYAVLTSSGSNSSASTSPTEGATVRH